MIAEDLALLRDGLTRLLRDNGFEVVDAVTDGDALVWAVLRERPDVAIVDIRLPPSFRDEGVRAALTLRERAPDTGVLIVSQYVEQAYAAELLAEARAGASEALRELRDLARGIHPPVLADRGLDAAVRALAAQSPISVTVSVTLPRRPDPPVESAAYFVIAEALANAGKHADASRVDVRISQYEDRLSVEIHDDGVGGADPRGGGLSGLRSRVQALDGSLAVVSPKGGPTTIRAELPCES